MWLQAAGEYTEVCYKVSSSNTVLLAYRGAHAESLPASCKKLKYSTLARTCVWSSRQKKVKGLCVSGRLAGCVWPPVFTHKQRNLQSDPAVWVWSPVSHSPSDTPLPQTQTSAGQRAAASPASLWFSGFFLWHSAYQNPVHWRIFCILHVKCRSQWRLYCDSSPVPLYCSFCYLTNEAKFPVRQHFQHCWLTWCTVLVLTTPLHHNWKTEHSSSCSEIM